MRTNQREHPEAVAEFDAAVTWYEQQEPGVGLRFVDQVQLARLDITEFPNAFPAIARALDGTTIRSKSIYGYPYQIVYAVETDGIVILAYAHSRRKPGYWLNRTNS